MPLPRTGPWERGLQRVAVMEPQVGLSQGHSSNVCTQSRPVDTPARSSGAARDSMEQVSLIPLAKHSSAQRHPVGESAPSPGGIGHHVKTTPVGPGNPTSVMTPHSMTGTSAPRRADVRGSPSRCCGGGGKQRCP